MEADAFQTTACWWLSLVVLVGVGLNAVLGWWWADPVAALGITYFLVREALEAGPGIEGRDLEPDSVVASPTRVRSARDPSAEGGSGSAGRGQ
jgi:endonuclease/exonuclease/phosphatase (EEP) superfamily protein YafD